MREPIFIKDWDDLKTKIPQESETHVLEIEDHAGWINVKKEHKREYPLDDDTDYDDKVEYIDHYLSTHSFYGSTHAWTTERLQRCGFNVICGNWDEMKGY